MIYNIRHSIFFAIILFSVSACENHAEFRVISKEDATEVKSGQFGDLYKRIEVITLETSEESLFANIYQTIICDSCILVRASFSDYTSDTGILQFTPRGDFIRAIGNIGAGPGEYQAIGSMVVRNDTLFAFDKWNECVHLYSVSDGRHLSDISDEACGKICRGNTIVSIPGSQDFLFTSDIIFGDNTYTLAEGNPIDGKVKTLIPQKFSVDGWVSYEYARPAITEFNGANAMMLMPLNDTIYTVDRWSRRIMPYVCMRVGTPMPKFRDGELYEDALEQVRARGANIPRGIHASRDYLIVNYTSGSIVWNMKDSKCYYTLNGWKKDEAEVLPFFPPCIVGATDDNRFVCAYDAVDVMEYCEAIAIDRHNISNMKTFDKLNEDSNKVLVIYSMK